MSVLDLAIFGLYMAGVLGVGYYFFRKNRSAEDYYVGGRSVSAGHVGLSIVATDVGGLDATLFGMGASAVVFVGVSLFVPDPPKKELSVS